jgi:glycosyltransferase involved in cell wall biosynthesis
VPPTPTVSVLTPAWNAAEFLPETYASLAAQTLPEWEWIVVDDGSTDATGEVLRAIAASDPRVTVLPQANSGLPAVGRNRALACARGEFVALLDADDLFEPTKLEAQVATLRGRPDAVLTWSDVTEFLHGQGEVPPDRPRWWPRREVPEQAFDSLLERDYLCTSTLLFPRSLVERIGTFDEDPAMKAMEDWDFVLRAAAEGPVVKTQGALARYRLHGGNISTRIGIERQFALYARLQRRGQLASPAGRRYRAGLHTLRAELGLAGHPGVDVRADFLEAFRLFPLAPARWVGLLSFVLPRAPMCALYVFLKKVQLGFDESLLECQPMIRYRRTGRMIGH